MESNRGINTRNDEERQGKEPNNNTSTSTANSKGGANVATAASMTSRIGSSVSSLARDVLSGSAGAASTTTSNLASLSASEKASGSQLPGPRDSPSASSSSWATNEVHQKNKSSERSSTANSGLENGFRETRLGPMEGIDAATFENVRPAEFMAESYASDTENPSTEAMSWREEFREESEDLQYVWKSNNAKGKEVSGDVAAASKVDGHAVVNILQDSDSLEGHEFLLRGEPQVKPSTIKEPSAEDLFGDQLSSSELAIRDQMLASLPRPREYRKINPESMNNFRPNIEMLHMPSTETADSLEALPSRALMNWNKQRLEWMQRWVNEWDGVLSDYVDEVWGTELPLVHEAKQQIEEMRKNETKLNDMQAVRRLKMILGHINVPGR